jgi:hypothetical protein
MHNADKTHPTLNEDINHLRESLKNTATPPKVERKVMNAFTAQQHRTSHISHTWTGQLGQWLAPGAAIAASLGMVVWLMIGGAVIGVKNAGSDVAAQEAPFIALQSLEQIALEPNPRLIETTVPKMLFASMGVAVSPEMASETVRAEMLVSAAGQPLALRLSRP